jgi:urease accessory protein
MSDGASRSESLQRATGELVVTVKRRDGASAIDRLRQSGCLKARFPRPVVTGWLDITTINSSGGVVGGDRLDLTIAVGAKARMTAAAQAAERFYRAPQDSAPAQVRTVVSVGEHAAAEWLPQETILFDRCALDRRLRINVASTGWFLGLEMLVFGRAAMGERVRTTRLRDLIEVRRDGELQWHDAIRLEGEAEAVVERAAAAGGARAVATIVHVAPDAEARLDSVRGTLAEESGATTWNGMLIARMLAPDSATLRRRVVAALAVLRDGRPLPRTWLC